MGGNPTCRLNGCEMISISNNTKPPPPTHLYIHKEVFVGGRPSYLTGKGSRPTHVGLHRSHAPHNLWSYVRALWAQKGFEGPFLAEEKSSIGFKASESEGKK
jgi:hypothetical protein